MGIKGTRFLHSQMSTRETKNVTHAGVSPQRGEVKYSFPPRKLGVDVFNDLVTFVIYSARPKSPEGLSQTLLS